ncbi:Pr6Pr family membrane protein [Dokdonella soli]|uniref:Pr6Pr family membrane protein n=1 Tax=Dokdonella soli TaxID=529810 RepID=A0ABN1IDD8_9GAMM
MPKPSLDRLFAAVVALVAWTALLLQYVLLIGVTRHDIGPVLATLRFFSFFTILSNLLVASATTCAVVVPRTMMGDLFTRPSVRGAAALCISITCGIYFFLLASTWSPQGAQLVADIMLHYVVPVLYMLWWIACVEHKRLVWTDAIRWLLLPLGFLVWTLARGAWLHEYPYPFVNVDTLGMAMVARNAFGIGLLFLVIGLTLVAFDRVTGRKR